MKIELGKIESDIENRKKQISELKHLNNIIRAQRLRITKFVTKSEKGILLLKQTL